MLSTGGNSHTSAYRELLSVEKVNETYLKVDCSRGIAQELNEFFSYFAPGYKFMPAFKRRQWDGRIRLFNNRNNGLYVGLLPYLKSFCDERDYDLEFDHYNVKSWDDFSDKYIQYWVEDE